MAHQRTTIRNALKSLLTGTSPTYATNAREDVFTNYMEQLQESDLPAIVIRDGPETVVPRDQRHTSFIRNWEVKIELTVQANTGYDGALDDLAKQVEDLIKQNSSITATATGAIYTGCEAVYDETGQKVIGKLSLLYKIQYIY